MSEKTGIKKIDLHYCLNTRLTKQVPSLLHSRNHNFAVVAFFGLLHPIGMFPLVRRYKCECDWFERKKLALRETGTRSEKWEREGEMVCVCLT